ncbi:sensor histidine kinase [Paenibacillus silviterrae]|uniref:sensor histidine kinase n=1 Tax=Paenibacillus silviterrae TaxID=3242194 RepID=UPI002542C302|nr:sensor histidine kinase [Paenibacillus chinjuensis]
MIKLTLSRRIFFYFLIVILISLVATALFTYWQSVKEFDRYMYNQMSQTANNAVHHTNLYLEEYERTILSLLNSQQVKKFVSLSPDDYYEHHFYGSSLRDNTFKQATFRNPEIASIYLLSNYGHYLYVNGNIQGLQRYHEKFDAKTAFRLLDQHSDERGGFEVLDVSAVSPEESSLLTLSRRVPKRDNIYEFNGILAIEIHKNKLEQLWKGIDLGENGYFYVVNDQGKIIYHPDSQQIGSQMEEALKSKLQNGSEGHLIHYEEAGDERVMFALPSQYADWNLVVSMSVNELRKPINNIRSNTIVMSAVTLIIALWIATRFGRSLVVPIQRLKKGMLQTEKGNWIQLPLSGRNDEMDDLTKSYNKMVGRLSELVDKVYKAELKERGTQVERQQAELHALQLQVNPHFLYNTLETIACYAMIQDSKEITGIVKYLADMFRYAVKTDLEEVTIANELKHVLNYLMIINYRTGGDFEIDVTIPPEYLLRNMVRLTLQPLVENAFQHAFPDGLESHHYIRIGGYMKDDEFIVTVEDNGVGMTRQRWIELTEKLKRNKLPALEQGHKGGIGVVNVHKRIQLVFGESYGLSIESEPSVGTKMLLRMPRTT